MSKESADQRRQFLGVSNLSFSIYPEILFLFAHNVSSVRLAETVFGHGTIFIVILCQELSWKRPYV